MINLSGKVMLVTGGGSGIGEAIARQLVELGAKVIATDVDAGRLDAVSSTIDRLEATLTHDVGSEEDWQRVIAHVQDQHGRLDGLLNVAGIMCSQPFSEASVEDLRRQMRVNVESVYIGTQLALPLLRQAKGAVVNVASVFGVVAGRRFAAYSATKGAVIALSRAIAVELAPEGIRVNAILPGPVATRLDASHARPLTTDGIPMNQIEYSAFLAKLIPLGRVGVGYDIGALAAFLVSEEASFITAASITADGGYSAV